MLVNRATRPQLIQHCKSCMQNPVCPNEVKALCACLKFILQQTNLEPHACMHACRDAASRCGCTCCRGKRDPNWRATAQCCFDLCDALDSFCEQRISLPAMLKLHSEDKAVMRCAFDQSKPVIPGTSRFVKPQRCPPKPLSCVYCANCACGAEKQYCHTLSEKGCDHLVYPGGLLEYYYRAALNPSVLEQISSFNPDKWWFRDCHGGCHP